MSRGLAAVVLSALVGVASVASAQTTQISLDSQHGDYIGGGTSRVITLADGPITAVKNGRNGVSIDFLAADASSFWNLDFGAAQDVLLTPGVYVAATRFAFHAPNEPGLDVYGDGRGCNTLTGQFTVHDIVYGAGTAITKFAATFEQHCEGMAPALFGTVLINATAPPTPTEQPALSVAAIGGTLHAEWLPSAVGGSPLRYRLEAGLSANTTVAAFETADTTPSLDVPGVPPGRFFLRVRPVEAGGLGAATEDVVVTIGPSGTSAPSRPLNFQAAMNGTRVTASWSAPSIATGVLGYLLDVGSTSGASNIASLPLTTTGFTYDPVPKGVYFLRVRAYNAAGLGEPSTEKLLVIDGASGPPGPPTLFKSTVTGATVKFDWGLPLQGNAPLRYRLEVGSAPGLKDLLTVETLSPVFTRTFAGVPPGRYYVRLRGANSWGLGAATSDLVVVVP